MALLSKLIIASVAAAAVLATPTTPFVADTSALPWTLFDQENKISYMDACVAVQYNASNEALGWDFLNVKVLEKARAHWTCDRTPAGVFYSLGFAEGYVTAARLDTVNFNARPNAKSLKWVTEHIAWMTAKVAANAAMGSPDPYWVTVGGILKQLTGLADGYNAARAKSAVPPKVSQLDMFLWNFGDEIGDVDTHFRAQEGSIPAFRKAMPPTHCSALIRQTQDDLFMAHDTWTDFPQMSLRMYKVYDFSAIMKNAKIAFSSAPGTVASGDDWYMTQHNLAIQETTNGVMNTTIFSAVVPQTVSEFIRVMVASYLAADGERWTTLFARHNSGTYNNQYMVVDWKKYAPGVNVGPGTLWVIEQLPGVMERADVSDVLAKQGYWASYNIPYFKNIFELSGYARLEREQGSFWSYTKYARPEIFARQAPGIEGLSAMMQMMRYNNYAHDKYSLIPNCQGATNQAACLAMHSSMLTIASRGDLMPLYNTTAEMTAVYGVLQNFVAQGCFGAIDSKIASFKNRHSMAGYAISGPTNDQQPTFQWGGTCAGKKPSYAPAVYDFPWIQWNI